MVDTNVFLFYPNLIGYGRIILAIVSLVYMLDSPFTAIFWLVFCCVQSADKLSYALSAGLDAFDGWAARTYNQSSRFGAMLDQLTDRCALMAICMALCHFYPKHMFFFQVYTFSNFYLSFFS